MIQHIGLHFEWLIFLKIFLNCWFYYIFQAIETGAGYGQWLHGEAVAAGMVNIKKTKLLVSH
jgi:hypothetical protein